MEGPHRIGWTLNESASTVHKVLLRNQMPRLCDIDRATKKVVRYQKERPGELIHIDIKKQARIPDGGGWRSLGKQAGVSNSHSHSRRLTGSKVHALGYDHLHIAVDDHSRIAYLEALEDERKETATAFTARALEWFRQLGIEVEAVMTDNGACHSSAMFRNLLQQQSMNWSRILN